jgi:tyrosyl-tRNA synthetase
MSEFSADKASRKAQKLLAYEVTKQVHGTETADSIARITDVLFGSHNYSSLQQNDFKELLKELPVAKINLGDSLVKVLVDTGLAGSNSEARRFIEQGAVYINGNQVIEETVLEQSHLLAQEFVILRRGKNSNAILRVTS